MTIYFLEVATFTFIIELNTLTWTFGSAFFLKLGYLRIPCLIWPHKMAISVVKNSLNYDRCFSMPSFWILSIYIFVLSSNYGVHQWLVCVLCTWIIIIGLVNTICGVPTTLVFIVGNFKFLFKFPFVKNLLDPQLTFIANLITNPFWQHLCYA